MGIFNEAKIIWASGQHFNQWVCIKSKFVAKNSAKTLMRASCKRKLDTLGGFLRAGY